MLTSKGVISQLRIPNLEFQGFRLDDAIRVIEKKKKTRARTLVLLLAQSTGSRNSLYQIAELFAER